MEIKINHTQKGGWAYVYINGESIGKQIRIPKDDFLNGDITIIKQIITGWEQDYTNGNRNSIQETIFKKTIKGSE